MGRNAKEAKVHMRAEKGAIFSSQRSQRNTDTRANTSASDNCKLECMFN